MILVSKNNWNKLDYNNTYHRTIELKPVDVRSRTYIDFGIENSHKHHKSKAGDHVRISKYKKTFAKGYTPNWSEEDW